MAVSRRANTSIHADVSTTSSTGVTITPPSGLVSGDWYVLSFYMSIGRTVTGTTPSTGWTSYGPVTLGSEIEQTTFVRQYTGEASWVISWGVGSSYGYVGQGYQGASGVVDAYNSNTAASGTSYSTAALSGTNGGMDIVILSTWNDDTQNTPTAPTGFTVAVTTGMTTANDPVAIWDRPITAGGSQAALAGTFTADCGGYVIQRLTIAPPGVAPTAPIVVQSAPVVSLTTAATSIAGTFGAAPTAGNLMVAIFGGRGGTGVTITPPSGWTQTVRINNSTTSFLAAYQKVVATGDGTTYSFGLGATARYAHMLLAEVSNQSPGTAVNVSASVLTAASTTPATPSVTPTNTNVLYLTGFLSTTTNGTSTAKAGWTEVGKGGNSSNTTTLEVQRMAEGADVNAQSGQVTWGASVATLTIIFAINPSVVNDAFSRKIVSLAGLQAYYRLDDSGFAKANDTWGNNGANWQNTTSVTLSQPGLITGGTDTAAVLSSAGNGGCAAMPTALGPTGTNAFTWIVLCKPTNSGANNQRVIGNDSWTSPGPNKGAALLLSGNGQLQTWRATDGLQSTSYIPGLIGSYHLFAVTYDSLALRLYCDGVCVFTNADTTSITTNGPNFLIGAAGAFGSNFDGTMDEVAILNAAVPGEAIADLWRLAQNNIPAANPQLTYGAYYNDGTAGWDSNPTVMWPAFVSKATNAGAAPNHVPKIAHFFQNWANNPTLNTAACDQAETSGAQPMLTWEAWDPAGGTGGNPADQPTYSLNNIANGNFNSYIDTFAASVATWGKPIFVLLFHEFNDDTYPWSIQQQAGNNNQSDYGTVNTPALLVSAWQLVVNRCRAAGATNVRWVWCLNRHYNYSGNGSFDGTSYPGDAYVDYAAFDMYNQLFSGAWEYPFDCGALVYQQIVGITNKPVLICEFGANPDAAGGTAVAWINDFLGTVVPTYFPNVVGVLMESDASASHANWAIDATTGTLAAYQAQYASSLYGGAALLPTSAIWTVGGASAIAVVAAGARRVTTGRAAAALTSAAMASGSRLLTSGRAGASAAQSAAAGARSDVAQRGGAATVLAGIAGRRSLTAARRGVAAVNVAAAGARGVTAARGGQSSATPLPTSARSMVRHAAGAAAAAIAIAGARGTASARSGAASVLTAAAGGQTWTETRGGALAVASLVLGSRRLTGARTGTQGVLSSATGTQARIEQRAGAMAAVPSAAIARALTTGRAGAVAALPTMVGTRGLAKPEGGAASAAATSGGSRTLTLGRGAPSAVLAIAGGVYQRTEARAGALAVAVVAAGATGRTMPRAGAAVVALAAAGRRGLTFARTGVAAAAATATGDSGLGTARTGRAAALPGLAGTRAVQYGRTGQVAVVAATAATERATRARSGSIGTVPAIAGLRGLLIGRVAAASLAASAAGGEWRATARSGAVLVGPAMAGHRALQLGRAGSTAAVVVASGTGGKRAGTAGASAVQPGSAGARAIVGARTGLAAVAITALGARRATLPRTGAATVAPAIRASATRAAGREGATDVGPAASGALRLTAARTGGAAVGPLAAGGGSLGRTLVAATSVLATASGTALRQLGRTGTAATAAAGVGARHLSIARAGAANGLPATAATRQAATGRRGVSAVAPAATGATASAAMRGAASGVPAFAVGSRWLASGRAAAATVPTSATGRGILIPYGGLPTARVLSTTAAGALTAPSRPALVGGAGRAFAGSAWRPPRSGD